MPTASSARLHVAARAAAGKAACPSVGPSDNAPSCSSRPGWLRLPHANGVPHAPEHVSQLAKPAITNAPEDCIESGVWVARVAQSPSCHAWSALWLADHLPAHR